MRLNLMSDVQYLSQKRAAKVRDQSFLLGEFFYYMKPYLFQSNIDIVVIWSLNI